MKSEVSCNFAERGFINFFAHSFFFALILIVSFGVPHIICTSIVHFYKTVIASELFKVVNELRQIAVTRTQMFER